jgi:hypothetical protein
MTRRKALERRETKVGNLKLEKVCGIGGIQNECLRQLPGRPLEHTAFI